MAYTANIIGATGLVGTELIKQLIADEECQEIRSFSRNVLELASKKLQSYIINFDCIDDWAHHIQGHVLFNCMGTTIRKAGSKEIQQKIDVTYPYLVAKAAKKNGVECMISVSSNGANENSRIFYSKIKGELESALFGLGFKMCLSLRPSLLLGDRKEKRISEKWAEIIMSPTRFLPFLRNIQPIHASLVAKNMIHGYKATISGNHLWENHQLLDLNKS